MPLLYNITNIFSHLPSQFFVQPCLEKGLLPEQVHSTIFGELATLKHMNEELHQTLVSENENIGTAFLRLAPFLKVYSSYAKNYQQAVNLLWVSLTFVFDIRMSKSLWTLLVFMWYLAQVYFF